MRRIVLIMMGLCLFMNMQAQTTERAKQQVAEVRRQYAEAQKMVEHSNLPHQDYYNDLTVKRRQMIGGPGRPSRPSSISSRATTTRKWRTKWHKCISSHGRIMSLR